MDLGFGLIDADNHYYETLDACTRHLDPEFRRRGVQVVHDGQAHAAARGREALQASSRTRRSTRSSCRAVSIRCSAARSPKASTRGR